MKKYICYGGWVRSADGDEHYITAGRVAELYKVNPAECIFYRDEHTLRGYEPDQIDEMIKLHPRSDGDYTLSAEK